MSADKRDKPCQGWGNRQTWNVVHWINNSQLRYCAVRFMRDYVGRKPYKRFIRAMQLEGHSTPDGICWNGAALAYNELNAFMRSLLGDTRP